MCNIFNINCCIDMDSFSVTSKAVMLVAIYISYAFQIKHLQIKDFGSGNSWGKPTKDLAALLSFFFSITYLTYFSDTILLSTVLKSVKFFLSVFLSIFKYRIFIFFKFMTHLHPILYKENSSVSRIFLPGYVNRHSRQLIYETNIPNNFGKFLTTFNSSVDYNFIFSHNFNFRAICNECILALYIELITILAKLKNFFFENFDYQKL